MSIANLIDLNSPMDDKKKEEILLYSETKRIAENLTKKEMCHIIGVSDNYYINCVTGHSKPSLALIKGLKEYLEMDTNEVYFKVFSFRSSPTYISGKNSDKFMVVKDNLYKEKYHEKMRHHEAKFSQVVEALQLNKLLEVPM